MGTLRSWRQRWSALDVLVRDALLAALLVLAVQVELALAEEVAGSRVLQVVAFTVMTGSVALRRRAPLVAPLLVGAGTAVALAVGMAAALERWEREADRLRARWLALGDRLEAILAAGPPAPDVVVKKKRAA